MWSYVNVTLSNIFPPHTHYEYESYKSNNMEGKGNVGEGISVSQWGVAAHDVFPSCTDWAW